MVIFIRREDLASALFYPRLSTDVCLFPFHFHIFSIMLGMAMALAAIWGASFIPCLGGFRNLLRRAIDMDIRVIQCIFRRVPLT